MLIGANYNQIQGKLLEDAQVCTIFDQLKQKLAKLVHTSRDYLCKSQTQRQRENITTPRPCCESYG